MTHQLGLLGLNLSMGTISVFLVPILFLIPIIIALKGYCLWHAAKRGEVWWFIALLILNTLGILELVYIVFVLKKITFPVAVSSTPNTAHEKKNEQ